jgi:small subunit ribosomal protein S21
MASAYLWLPGLPNGAVHNALASRGQQGETVQVLVRDNNVDQALRVLKKKLQREGVFREMKERRAYEKPSEKKARQRAEAIRRARKLARKQAQREGLLPQPKKREAPARRPVYGSQRPS